MKFFMFHLMPWAHLPAAYAGPAWVKCPNAFYDGRRGHELYNRYLDELVRAETLGFDGVCVNEHHANAYGNMPSPNLIAAILARQTERVRIAVVGNALPLYNPPTRVAEEYAMIDCISGGRLIAGMVVGFLTALVLIVLGRNNGWYLLGVREIGAGLFGVPVGFLVIWAVSLMYPPPDQRTQELVESVRYPKGAIKVAGID